MCSCFLHQVEGLLLDDPENTEYLEVFETLEEVGWVVGWRNCTPNTCPGVHSIAFYQVYCAQDVSLSRKLVFALILRSICFISKFGLLVGFPECRGLLFGARSQLLDEVFVPLGCLFAVLVRIDYLFHCFFSQRVLS